MVAENAAPLKAERQDLQCSGPERQSGETCKDPKRKADHLAETFKTKYILNETETNHYSEIEVPCYRRQRAGTEMTEDIAEKVLSDLRDDSATGPDELPARVLKECASELGKPFCILAKLILAREDGQKNGY